VESDHDGVGHRVGVGCRGWHVNEHLRDASVSAGDNEQVGCCERDAEVAGDCCSWQRELADVFRSRLPAYLMAVRAVYARQDFTPVGRPGRPVLRGDLFRSDDPLVRKHPELFVDVNEELGIVERATRNPGQKRAKKPVVELEPVAEVEDDLDLID
jgi:hypothetical protein